MLLSVDQKNRFVFAPYVAHTLLFCSSTAGTSGGQTQKCYGITSPISLAGPKPGVGEGFVHIVTDRSCKL